MSTGTLFTSTCSTWNTWMKWVGNGAYYIVPLSEIPSSFLTKLFMSGFPKIEFLN